MLGLGLVLLACAVFAWGLRYKLSLYQSPHAVNPHVPAAKLLVNGKERMTLPAAQLRSTAHPGAPAVLGGWFLVPFALAGSCVLSAAAVSRAGFVPLPLAVSRSAGVSRFDRPPPFLR